MGCCCPYKGSSQAGIEVHSDEAPHMEVDGMALWKTTFLMFTRLPWKGVSG